MDSPTSARKLKPVGELVEVKFPVGISLILFLLVCLSGLIFWYYPRFRDELTFFGVAFGMAGGVVAAYYIGRTLQITVNQRDELLDAERVNKAFSYIHRWNATPFDERKHFRSLMNKIRALSPTEVTKQLDADQADRAIVVDVMNFFEEMSIAINEGLADEETLVKFFRSMLEWYYQRFSDWIQNLRTDGGGRPRPRVYIQLEEVAKRWQVRG
jgi:Domain of unknown function (DUF4760)